MKFCWDAVCHGSELPFVFHSDKPSGWNFTDAEGKIATQMNIYWTNFATSGSPNQGIRKEKEKFDSANGKKK